MTTQSNQQVNQAQTMTANRDASVPPPAKQPFVAPKLTFVTPKLTKRGDFADLTEGFFGTFTPPAS